MQDPSNNKDAATRAAGRWKKGNKADELKEQIIATFRLQKVLADRAASDAGTGAVARRQVANLWTAAFRDDPIPGYDFTT
jgi:hypothetical protein